MDIKNTEHQWFKFELPENSNKEARDWIKKVEKIILDKLGDINFINIEKEKEF